MAEWKEYTVADVISTVIDYRGKTPKKLGGDWSNSGYRALSAKNIKTGKIVQSDSIRYVSEDMYRCWMKEEVQKEDILITSEAPYGQIYYWNSDEKIVLSQRLYAIRINQQFYPKYVYFYMTSSFFQAELDGRATGTTVVGLRRPELLKCKIFAPDFQEQKRIADTLWCLEQKINNNEAINNNLEQQIEMILLKTINGTDTQPVKLGDYLYIKGRIGWKGLKKSEYLPISNYRIINGESLTLSGIDWNKAGYISAERYEESPEIMLSIGDILLSKDGTIGKIGYVDKLDAPTSVASGIFVIRNTRQSEISTQFIYYLLKSKLFKAFIASRTEGSVIPHLYQKDFMEFEFQLPSPVDMKIFDDTTADMFSLVFSNLNENERLIHLRDALLPKLMSGELDVSDIEL